MKSIEKLRAASTLQDVANILGFEPKSLSYILYIKPSTEKYIHFEISKRSGGKRLISAPYPNLKTLQKRLSNLLVECIADINKTLKFKSSLSHGFKRKHSIITNADSHRNKRYVFNIDLENFFGTINFGRVRGFFITNRNFELNPAVATVLAQIICHENALPQGSPCSPITSNIIGHILDIRLAAFARQVGCKYSRYADDLTFSTNKLNFPTEVAEPIAGGMHQWKVGKNLADIICKTGFVINNAKTRLQYKDSRQVVTGLVVNSKINTRAEYRRTARAMVDRLLETGKFYRKFKKPDDSGNLVLTEEEGTLNQLNGILSFIYSVGIFNKKRIYRKLKTSDMSFSDKEKRKDIFKKLTSHEKTYQDFLLYKYFYSNPLPLILCEGKTDLIYIKAAIRQLAVTYPQLVKKEGKGGVSCFSRTKTTGHILGLGEGGTDEFTKFMDMYWKVCKSITTPGKTQPIILLIDNDKGANSIYGYIKNKTKPLYDNISLNKNTFIFIKENFYVVPTPLTNEGKDTKIEDFFDQSVLDTKLNGKTFNPSNEGVNDKTEYGKAYFAEHVVRKNEKQIDFSKFKPILDRISEVLAEHQNKPS
ncbi:MAG: retron Ec67 family RNA-directed DNA polymerase/endonuclease [Nitrosomonas sp.]|nr:retron Ec67 family RNA-directed DNA polymerase/endonuclease [Nitrosomonas sp.]